MSHLLSLGKTMRTRDGDPRTVAQQRTRKLFPLSGSELAAFCASLVRDARTQGMQASPYDLQHRGLSPIKVSCCLPLSLPFIGQ